MKRILLIDKHGQLKKEFKSAKEAEQKTGVSIVTIYHQCKYETNSNHDHFRYKEVDNKIHNYTRVVMLDMEGNFIKSYSSQAELAREKNLSYATINHLLRGRMKPKDFRLVYEDNYTPKECNETKQKRKETEYYVNVLVGLANQTLIDGATYEINGSKMKYSRENNALMVGDKKIYSYENMWNVVSIELPLLQPEEKAFLQNLLKAFSNAKGIIKCKDRRQGYEFIRVETANEEDTITLPSFVEGKYYKSLQRDTLYSLKDLELD